MAINMKIAVVTGSNKGIGRGIVETLCKVLPNTEWNIYLTARNSELGLKTKSELESQGMKVKFHQLDIDCETSRITFREYLRSKYGGLDILINNAGIAYKNDSPAPFSEQAEITLKTNFFNTLRMCQEFVPILRENARLVNLSSMMSHMTLKKLRKDIYDRFLGPMKMNELVDLMEEFVKAAKEDRLEAGGWVKQAYGLSKVGVTKMTFLLAEELKGDSRHIMINACCPGYVDTDMTSHKGPLTIYEGADTPVYLATLPIGTDTPYGQHVEKRVPVDWR